MNVQLTWLRGSVQRLGVLLLIYALCRILFLLINYSYFKGMNTGTYFSVFGAGLLFDASALLMVNSVYLVMVLLPFSFRQNAPYKKVIRWIFIFSNSIFILFNLTDIGYFPYTLNRSNWGMLEFATGKVDILELLPAFFTGYWYLLLIWLVFCWVLVYVDKKLIYKPAPEVPRMRYLLTHLMILILAGASFILIYRGGFRFRPLHMVDAGTFVEARFTPLVLNTPFTMLKSIETGTLEEVNFMSDTEAQKLFDPVLPTDTGVFQKRNIIIFILESFSKEYTGSSGLKSYTPFLDSLSSQGLFLNNAFANGKRSIEALPAIVASIPSLMPEPYITSTYGTNHSNTLPMILKKYGYTSSFYHGATNGSMGFDSYAGIAGFDRYVGRTEYNNEKDFDGHWGIWDGPFLDHFAKDMDKEKQPFFSTLFTLSSHHPYEVPKGMESKYEAGTYEIHRTIRYTDDQLRRFFHENKNKDWFKNTLFVFVADHTGVSAEPAYMHYLGQHKIPILFYSAQDSLQGTINEVTQQADIMPTLMDILNIPGKKYGYGRSVLKGGPGYALFHINNQFHFVNDSLYMTFDGERVLSIFNHRTDSLFYTDLMPFEKNYQPGILFMKAVIQRYNYDMIHNRLHAE